MANTWFVRVVVIPSAVFLSALFGGAYGSGREVVEFISRHGPWGGFVAILAIAGIYAICMFLIYELARIFRTWEYRGFAGHLLGRAKIVYEILLIIGLLLGLAICASAGGAIGKSHFGLPVVAGGSGVLLIIVGLIFFGRKIVEESMVLAVTALAIALVYLLFSILTRFGPELHLAFYEATPGTAGVGTGIKYALTNCGFLTLLLYSVVDLRSRKETAVTACTAAIAGVLPAVAFHLAFMTAYPAVVDIELPAYWLIENRMSSMFLNVYVAIVFILVAQTGVALLQGVVESLDKLFEEKRGAPMTRTAHAAISGVAVMAASLFATVGIVELIVRVYGFLSLSFFLVFFIPLFTRGAWLIFVDSRR